MSSVQNYARQRQQRNRIIKQQLNKIVSLKSSRQKKQPNSNDQHNMTQQQFSNKTLNNTCNYQQPSQSLYKCNQPFKQVIEQQENETESRSLMMNRQDVEIQQQRRLQEQNLILKQQLKNLQHEYGRKIILNQQEFRDTNEINQKQYNKIKTEIQSMEEKIYTLIEQMQKIEKRNKNLEKQIFMSVDLMNQSLQEKDQFYQKNINQFINMFQLANSNINLMELQQQNDEISVVQALNDSEIMATIENKIQEADPDIEMKIDQMKKKLVNLIQYSKEIEIFLEKSEKAMEKQKQISEVLYNKIIQNKFGLQMQKEENRKRGQNLTGVKNLFSQILNVES